jgi:hypothetical protein
MSYPKNQQPKKLYSVVTIFWKDQMFGFSMFNWTKNEIEFKIHKDTLTSFSKIFEQSHMQNQLNSPNYVEPNGPRNCVSISKQEIKELEKQIDDFVRDTRYYDYTSPAFQTSQAIEVFCKLYFLSRFVNSNFLQNECKILGAMDLLVNEYQIKFVCEGCQKISLNPMKKCGACTHQSVYFCSKDCQKQNWSKHSNKCERLSTRKNDIV